MSGSRQLSACSKAPHDTAVIPTDSNSFRRFSDSSSRTETSFSRRSSLRRSGRGSVIFSPAKHAPEIHGHASRHGHNRFLRAAGVPDQAAIDGRRMSVMANPGPTRFDEQGAQRSATGLHQRTLTPSFSALAHAWSQADVAGDLFGASEAFRRVHFGNKRPRRQRTHSRMRAQPAESSRWRFCFIRPDRCASTRCFRAIRGSKSSTGTSRAKRI